MLALRGGYSSHILFRELFLRHLPEQVRLALANSFTTDLRALAKEADKLCLAKRHVRAAGWTQEPTKVAPAPSPAEPTLLAAMARRPNPTPPPHPLPDRTLCYYHARFGQKARSC